jgi:hypothetical protein
MREFHLYAFTYTPHPAVICFIINYSLVQGKIERNRECNLKVKDLILLKKIIISNFSQIQL